MSDNKKPVFDLSSAVSADGSVITLDDKGRLTSVPTNWSKEARTLQRTNFADKGHFYEWKIVLEEVKIARINERIAELRDSADEARKGPDPTRKAVKKLARMAKHAAELRAQLEAEGVDLSELEGFGG